MASTPLALRLDSSSRFNVPSRKVIAIVLAILVIGSVAGLLLTRGSKAPAKPVAISANPTSIVSAPQTSDGAVIASSSFLLYYASLLNPSNGGDPAFLNSVLDANTTQTLRSQIDVALSSGQKALKASNSHYVLLTPLAFKSSFIAGSDPTVSIWNMLVLGSGAQSQSYWTTSDFSLHWQNNQWMIAKWTVRTGPQPAGTKIASGASANNGPSLIEVRNGYKSYGSALSLDSAVSTGRS